MRRGHALKISADNVPNFRPAALNWPKGNAAHKLTASKASSKSPKSLQNKTHLVEILKKIWGFRKFREAKFLKIKDFQNILPIKRWALGYEKVHIFCSFCASAQNGAHHWKAWYFLALAQTGTLFEMFRERLEKMGWKNESSWRQAKPDFFSNFTPKS